MGGALFVGAPCWYLYLTGEGDVEVDFNNGNVETALEAGGPMRRDGKSGRQMVRRDEHDHDNGVIEGKDPEKSGTASPKEMGYLRHSGGI